MIKLIACTSLNRTIGDNGKIPWRIKEDLIRFRVKTLNGNIVMGRKTWESLPAKPLSSRNNIILTKNIDLAMDILSLNKYESNHHCYVWTVEKVIEQKSDMWIIGGEEIYKIFLPYADEIHLTIVHGYVYGDAKFPELSMDWCVKSKLNVPVDRIDGVETVLGKENSITEFILDKDRNRHLPFLYDDCGRLFHSMK